MIVATRTYVRWKSISQPILEWEYAPLGGPTSNGNQQQHSHRQLPSSIQRQSSTASIPKEGTCLKERLLLSLGLFDWGQGELRALLLAKWYLRLVFSLNGLKRIRWHGSQDLTKLQAGKGLALIGFTEGVHKCPQQQQKKKMAQNPQMQQSRLPLSEISRSFWTTNIPFPLINRLIQQHWINSGKLYLVKQY